MRAPLPYAPAIEQPAPDEAATERRLRAAMRRIQGTTWRDYGHAVRPVHAKSHAILQGEMEIPAGLPPEYAQGIFARPGRHEVILRLSTNPGDVLDDDISSPRGMAIKVLGVKGERLAGSEGSTQDFVMVNAPAFAAPGPAEFAGNLDLLAATTDTGQGWKKALSAALRGAAALGLEHPAVKTLGGHPLTHPLGETFHTTTPFRHGGHVAKYSLAPATPALQALKDQPVDLAGRPNGLREAAIAFLAEHGGEWEFRAQLWRDAEAMPIEDASVEWPEAASPHVAIARIRVWPQPAWSEARARQVDDGLSFSPWHGIADHRPLGAVNRARRHAYGDAARFRGARSGCPVAHEPRGAMMLSDAPAEAFGQAPGREGRRPGTPDHPPGVLGQPMNETARHLAAGAAGGVLAGLAISAIFLAGEAVTGRPSDLIAMNRKAAGKLGLDAPAEGSPPTLAEELVGHGGHLALSAASGAAYALAVRGEGDAALRGLAFGLGFHALAFGVVAPAAGLAPPVWRDDPRNQALHIGLHALFGVVTGVAAARLAKRL